MQQFTLLRRLGGKMANTYTLLNSRAGHRRSIYVKEMGLFTVLQAIGATIAGGLLMCTLYFLNQVRGISS